jgi:hypothetical protein
MSTIKVVILSALAEKNRDAQSKNNRVLSMALTQLNDEFNLMPADVEKERVTKVIKLNRVSAEQNWCQLIESDEEDLAELSASRDTVLAELAEIIRQQ